MTTRFDLDRHHRRSIRLSGYDYAEVGVYFVTICTHRRENLFGEIVGGEMKLSEIGKIAVEEWRRTPNVRRNVKLDEWVVMPNHIHGIIAIVGATRVRATRRVAPTPPTGPQSGSLGAIIGQYKSIVTKRVNALSQTTGISIWQRNYYEHIIRNERALNSIREYIANNPLNWHRDIDNPVNWENQRLPETVEDYLLDVAIHP